MLDKTQEQILVLLEEIDQICRENNIEYFLDGGTVIGAVRHEGFIPWDNDADIAMTEDNYNKFAEIVNRDTERTHRTVQDITINSEHPLEIGKYINTDMTKITKTGAFWNGDSAMAGMVVDIFKLIPLPKDEKEKEKKCQLFNVYTEYCNESIGRTEKRTDYFDKLYRRVSLAGKIFGKKKVKKYLEKEIFNQKYPDSEYYLYCSGSKMHPIEFPKEIYDQKPIRVKFENLNLPIMQQYHELLRLCYGDDYWKIPVNEIEMKVHASLFSENIPYKYYVKDYMRMLSVDEVKAKRKSAKDAFVKLAVKRKKAAKSVCGINVEMVKESLNAVIETNNFDLQKEYEDGNYALLDELFEEYYELQFSNFCKRWPIIIDLPEDQLYYAIMNLISGKSDIAKAAWIIKSYKEVICKDLPQGLLQIQKLLDCIFIARSAYDYGDYNRGLRAIEDGLKLYPNNKELNCWKLTYEANCLSLEEETSIMSHVEKLLGEYPNCVEVLKAKGDFLWRKGCKEEALDIYDSIFGRTQDGMLKLDITRKRREK